MAENERSRRLQICVHRSTEVKREKKHTNRKKKIRSMLHAVIESRLIHSSLAIIYKRVKKKRSKKKKKRGACKAKQTSKKKC